MLWGCFSAFGTGNLIKVKGIMKTKDYKKTLKDNLRQSATKHGLGRHFVFQHDRDSYLISGVELPPNEQSERP